VPVELLAEAPKYRKPTAEPAWLAERRAFDPLTLPEPSDYTAALAELLASPTIASKEWAFRQYDQQVGINTLVLPGSDAAVLRVKGTRRALAVSTDGTAVRCSSIRGKARRWPCARRRATCPARAATPRSHRLSEFRLARAPGDPLAIRRGDRRHRDGVPCARPARGRR
jgi:phosphoribosylformylglycinamidine synthase